MVNQMAMSKRKPGTAGKKQPVKKKAAPAKAESGSTKNAAPAKGGAKKPAKGK